MTDDIPVIILCGGRGTRLNERTGSIPKPLVDVGGMPILWHIMKGYAVAGFHRFVLCLGYMSNAIREYVAHHADARWEVQFSDAGPNAETGERIHLAMEYVDAPVFFATYGDNVSNVSPAAILASHKQNGCAATVTCIRARTTFGVVDLAPDGLVSTYHEKPYLDLHVNGGFYCFNREVTEYIQENEVFEQEPIQRLVSRRQMGSYIHDGFWACMDTLKDNQALNALWDSGIAPWKTW